MKVVLSSIVDSKVKSATAEEREAVRMAVAKLRGAKNQVGDPVPGVARAYQVRTTPSGPVLLYEMTGDVAHVKGMVTSRQRELGNVFKKKTVSGRGRTGSYQKNAQGQGGHEGASQVSSGQKGGKEAKDRVSHHTR